MQTLPPTCGLSRRARQQTGLSQWEGDPAVHMGSMPFIPVSVRRGQPSPLCAQPSAQDGETGPSHVCVRAGQETAELSPAAAGCLVVTMPGGPAGPSAVTPRPLGLWGQGRQIALM